MISKIADAWHNFFGRGRVAGQLQKLEVEQEHLARDVSRQIEQGVGIRQAIGQLGQVIDTLHTTISDLRAETTSLDARLSEQLSAVEHQAAARSADLNGMVALNREQILNAVGLVAQEVNASHNVGLLQLDAQKGLAANFEQAEAQRNLHAAGMDARLAELRAEIGLFESRVASSIGETAREVNAFHNLYAAQHDAQKGLAAHAEQAEAQRSLQAAGMDARLAELRAEISLFESRVASSIGETAQEVNAFHNLYAAQLDGQKGLATHVEQAEAQRSLHAAGMDAKLAELRAEISLFEARVAASIGETAREVNAFHNLYAGQLDSQKALAATANEITAKLASAASVNTALEQTMAQLRADLTNSDLRANTQISTIAGEVNAALNLAKTQQDALKEATRRLAGIEARTGVAEEAMPALKEAVLALKTEFHQRDAASSGLLQAVSKEMIAEIGRAESRGVARTGPLANEINAILNLASVIKQAQTSTTEAIARIEAKSLADSERMIALNLLVGRSMSSLLHRQKQTSADARRMESPQKPLAVENQLAKLKARAPANFDQWNAACQAGIIAGQQTSEGNLSHEGHIGAGYFRMFVNVHARGRLLDFGCGPLAMPSYLADWPSEQLAGFDPQAPFEQHPFPFAMSLGEFIPWPDASFETVVIATSLDHVYLLDQALAEVKRVLTPDGRLLIWTAMFPQTTPYDPYGAPIKMPDPFHLFHPGQNWFYDLFQADYEMIERLETVAQAELIAFQRKPAAIKGKKP